MPGLVPTPSAPGTVSKNHPVQATSEELGPCHLRVDVQVPAARVAQEFDHAYRDAARGVKVPGFRPGKAPAHVLRKMLGDGVVEHAREHLVEHVAGDAMRELGIAQRVIRVLDLDASKVEVEDGQETSFSFEVETLPELELPSWGELEVEPADTTPSDDQVQQAMSQLGQQHQRFEEAEGAAVDEEHLAEGDLLYLLGDEEGPQAAGLKMGLGNPLYGAEPETYDAAMKGAQAGATLEIPVEFKDGFSNEDWVGKQGVARFTVSQVVKPRPAEAAEIAEDLGLESAEALQEKVLERIRWENERQDRERLAFESLEAICKVRPFQMPPRMVHEEAESAVQNAVERMKQNGAEEEAAQAEADKHREELAEDAERRLRHWFLIRRIAAEEKIRVSSRELDEAYRGIAAREQVDVKDVKAFFKQQGREDELRGNVMEAKVRAFLVAKVEERQAAAVASGTGEE